MAEKVMVSEQYLQDVADSIRTKLNTEDKYKPSEFSSKIDGMNVAKPIEKGLVIKECDDNGYASVVEVIGLTALPAYAFGTYSTAYLNLLQKVNTVTLPENMTEIGSHAFYYATRLKTLILPKTLTKIGDGGIRQTPLLILTELPDTLTSIGSYAFEGDKKLALTKIPPKLKSISDHTFKGCTDLQVNEIHSGITSIGSSSFYECKGFTKMRVLGNNVEIKNDAFRYTSLIEFECVGTITSIGNIAFCNNSDLIKFVINNITPPTFGTKVFNNTAIADGTGYIYVPDESIEAYQTATNWSTWASQIKGLSELEVSE